MKKDIKIIIHIDLNAFFATCAIIKEPYLKDKVFVVGGPGRNVKGVISTASYKARKYGIHAGMSTKEAQDIFPKLLIVPSDFSFYYQKSKEFINLLQEYSKLVLQASIDEAYLDITELSKEKHPLEIAKEIQSRLLDQYQLPSSIGIAPTLFLAKMASDLKKPLGITVLRIKDVPKLLYPLDISEMFGIGKKTYPRLIENGVTKIKDLVDPSKEKMVLSVIKPSNLEDIRKSLYGLSSNVVDPYKYALPKSISNETTFNYTISDENVLKDEFISLAERLIKRMKSYKMVAKTITIKFKTPEFTVFQKSHTISDYTNDEVIIKDILLQLFEEHFTSFQVRLIGVGLGNLILLSDYNKTFDLFTYNNYEE